MSKDKISETLRSKQWFAFDLDDTLHDFRKASGAALEAVVQKIRIDHGKDVDETKRLYGLVLMEKTASAFTDGRLSRDYRKERFEALGRSLRLEFREEYLDSLADKYQTRLASALKLKSGAMSLLSLLKQLGKSIAIVTEGPEDAQVWTIQQLGLADLVDYLATTNRLRVSKVDGLLQRVLESLEISPDDVVYIGDSWSRDMEPAMKEGVYSIHYRETDNISLHQYPIKLNTLWKLQSLLEED